MFFAKNFVGYKSKRVDRLQVEEKHNFIYEHSEIYE